MSPSRALSESERSSLPSGADRRIRSLRPPKPFVDPDRAHGSLIERERRPDGTLETALTVFLAGAECPFTCAFCDLWQWTIDGPARPGALTRQLEAVVAATDLANIQRLKLYNASNFFDSHAVPAEDVDGIAALARGFRSVTVESHAGTIGEKTLAFSRRIPARLEVAVGLETIHPVALASLNKRLDVGRFDAAARLLRDNGIDLRVFVLLGAPYVPAADSREWTLRTVEHAVEQGASVISIIPLRGGNGEMERLQGLGELVPPTLRDLETVLDEAVRFAGAVVTADLWDVERLPACELCCKERFERMRRINLTGAMLPPVECVECD